jgi:aldehyde:ferredoxin oxidoreductase
MGADHTAGLVIKPGISEQEMVTASQLAQLANAAGDSSGFCMFLNVNLDDIRTFYGHLYGEDVSREQIADMTWQILQDEWEFNRRAGLTEKDDDMPDCMKQDAIGPANVVWDVSPGTVKQAHERRDLGEELFEIRTNG